jgi:hypothetical protein
MLVKTPFQLEASISSRACMPLNLARPKVSGSEWIVLDGKGQLSLLIGSEPP